MNNIFIFLKNENTAMHVLDSHELLGVYIVWALELIVSIQDQHLLGALCNLVITY